jgi:hypothetical protein
LLHLLSRRFHYVVGCGIEPMEAAISNSYCAKICLSWCSLHGSYCSHIEQIGLTWALLSVPILCICVSLVHCKHPVTFLYVHSASLDSQWPTDTDEYQPMPERLRKDSLNLISHLKDASNTFIIKNHHKPVKNYISYDRAYYICTEIILIEF